MNKSNVWIITVVLFLLPTIVSAIYATYPHSGFRIADGKDIDLNGRIIGNGTITATVVNNITYADQFATLQAAINAADVSKTEVYISNKTYNENINIPAGVTIKGNGENSIVKGVGNGNVINITGEDIKIFDVIIDGSDMGTYVDDFTQKCGISNYYSGAGHNVDRFEAHNVKFQNIRSYSSCLVSYGSTAWYNTEVRNSRHGLGFDISSNNQIIGGRMYNATGYGIFFYGAGSGNTVDSVDISSSYAGVEYSLGQSYGSVSNSVVHDSPAFSSGNFLGFIEYVGFYAVNAKAISFFNNHAYNIDGSGFSAEITQGVSFIGGSASNNKCSGYFGYDSHNGTIIGVTIYNNNVTGTSLACNNVRGDGINMQTSSYNNIALNQIYDDRTPKLQDYAINVTGNYNNITYNSVGHNIKGISAVGTGNLIV